MNQIEDVMDIIVGIHELRLVQIAAGDEHLAVVTEDGWIDNDMGLGSQPISKVSLDAQSMFDEIPYRSWSLLLGNGDRITCILIGWKFSGRLLNYCCCDTFGS